MKYSKIENSELVGILKTKSQTERNLTIEIIEILAELEVRKLYLDMGYGSLIDFCIKELKYSEGSAYRRIAAAKMLIDVPEVKNSLIIGSLNLATIAQAHTFIKQEKKYNNKKYSPEEKRNFIFSLENKSKRECERIFSQKSPGLPKFEKLRQLTEDKVEITMVVDQKLLEQLDELKNVYSHIKPGANYSEIIGIMAQRLLKKGFKKRLSIKEPTKKRSGATPPGGVVESMSESKPRSRYIPADIKRKVYEKAGGSCSYVDLKTKRRCFSKFQLEYDHIFPFSMGGENSEENLRLVCRKHNQFYAKSLELDRY